MWMHRQSTSEAVLLKQSQKGRSKLAQQHKHQSRLCTSACPPAHMSKGCWSPGCHRPTALNTRNHHLKVAWPHILLQHKHTLSLLSLLKSLKISLQFIYCHWVNWDRELAFAELHSRGLFRDRSAFSYWGSFVCLSVCPSYPDRLTNLKTLTHGSIFQMGKPYIFMVNCADFFSEGYEKTTVKFMSSNYWLQYITYFRMLCS